ncbi:hypothetical protein [Bradyrhizobium sp. USDA 3240]
MITGDPVATRVAFFIRWLLRGGSAGGEGRFKGFADDMSLFKYSPENVWLGRGDAF